MSVKDQSEPRTRELELKIIADSVWTIPSPGETRRVQIALRFKNSGPEPVCLRTIDTIWISLRDVDGETLQMDGGRDGTKAGKTVTDPIQSGGEYSIDRTAELEFLSDGSLRLIGDDGFGGIWYVDGLRAGRYSLQMEYHNDQARGKEQACVWTGSISAPPLEIVLEKKNDNN